MAAIVGIQLGHLRERLTERRLSLEVTPDAELWLANAGYDEDYGARPLKRLIQREISDRVALALLEGRYGEQNSVVKVDVDDGHLVLR
jgi:ATP-dependent Clp protease ATP-binding subunit ClpB